LERLDELGLLALWKMRESSTNKKGQTIDVWIAYRDL
jgi:hypothetical protein